MKLIIEGPEKKLDKIARISRAFGIKDITTEADSSSSPAGEDETGEKKKSKSKKSKEE